METAIIAVVATCFLASTLGYLYFLNKVSERLSVLESLIIAVREEGSLIIGVYQIANEIRETLVEASKRNALKAKESVFEKVDNAKIQPAARYIPVARRRAMAEAATLTSQNHADEVRKNNQKVLETL